METLHDHCCRLRYCQIPRVDRQLRTDWRLVRIIDAGKAGDFTASGPGVKALDVAPLALVERSRNVNLDEVIAQPADEAAGFLVRRNKRRHHEYSVMLEPARDVAHPPHVCVAIGPGKAGLRENIADSVAVEMLDFVATPTEPLQDFLRDRTLSRSGKPGKPENGRTRFPPADLDAIPDPLMQPEDPDLRNELERSDRERQGQAPREDENEARGRERAQNPPCDGLRYGSRV
jgi:hypothetical protein